MKGYQGTDQRLKEIEHAVRARKYVHPKRGMHDTMVFVAVLLAGVFLTLLFSPVFLSLALYAEPVLYFILLFIVGLLLGVITDFYLHHLHIMQKKRYSVAILVYVILGAIVFSGVPVIARQLSVIISVPYIPINPAVSALAFIIPAIVPLALSRIKAASGI